MDSIAKYDMSVLGMLLALMYAARQHYCLRGVTYRRTVIPLSVERAGKAGFYLLSLAFADAGLRRFGEALWAAGLCVPPASSRMAVRLRLALLHVPMATWALLGPLSVAGSTRDDRGFSLACTRSRLWFFISQWLFNGRTKIFLSEEWRNVSEEDRAKWAGRHYVIGMHPHGLLPIGAILNGLTWAGGGLTGVTTSGAKLSEPANAGDGLHQRWFPRMELRAAVASGACGLTPGFYEMFTKLGAF
mmetsp:Transcript_39174/g.77541  ORF Transcript_39174/g.77541 Transcript_39174/m.77541 type:complete len:245 (-) Transcript_39174:10-744(-)